MSDIVENLQNIKNKLREGVCGQREIWEGQLEEAIGAHADLSRRLAEAGREIEWLRAALVWYSEMENYRAKPSDPMTSHGVHRASPVERDWGNRAKAALTTTPPPGSAAG